MIILASVALAEEEFVFQYGKDGYENTKDTHITEYSGNNGNNMGGNIENECCEYDPANVDGKSILIWFDVSSIPIQNWLKVKRREQLRQAIIKGCRDMNDVSLEIEQEYHPLAMT